MTTPTELKFAPSHEWVKIEADGTVAVGISDHAQEALGDIVFLEFPKVGRVVAAEEAVAVVESVKAASDIYAPVAGEIVAVNDALADTPEAVNNEPYASWMFKIKPANAADVDGLLSAADYDAANA
ncbi:MAG: glycine cleavage system protein GcvH [Hydromonas sp.]|jgi:glycine cleavage system H protein|nr:glycine cleavage system protein GcvH [Hydromonas sp.]